MGLKNEGLEIIHTGQGDKTGSETFITSSLQVGKKRIPAGRQASCGSKLEEDSLTYWEK